MARAHAAPRAHPAANHKVDLDGRGSERMRGQFQAARPGTVGWREVTIIPFTFGLLRYLLLVSGGRGAAPEEVLFGDGFMQLVGLAWLLSLTPGLG